MQKWSGNIVIGQPWKTWDLSEALRPRAVFLTLPEASVSSYTETISHAWDDVYEAELFNVLEIVVWGLLGEGCTITEIKIINCVVKVTADGLEYEADPDMSSYSQPP